MKCKVSFSYTICNFSPEEAEPARRPASPPHAASPSPSSTAGLKGPGVSGDFQSNTLICTWLEAAVTGFTQAAIRLRHLQNLPNFTFALGGQEGGMQELPGHRLLRSSGKETPARAGARLQTPPTSYRQILRQKKINPNKPPNP